MSFADLKRKSQNSFADLAKKLEESSSSNVDTRFWKPSVDAAGNGFAVIRFLPEPDGEDMPFVKLYSHAFQGDGGWYIENSLTTNGGKDPVAELNRRLWNSGRDSDKEVARKQKRKLSYYANIYVVQDKANPENEGKVFLYKFGKKIFDKIQAATSPEFEDETPVNPFDLWEGANFKLKIRNVEGYWNYDKSEFATSSALSSDESVMERVWRQCYSLQQFTAPENFKTYAELEERLNTVLNLTPAGARAAQVTRVMDEEEDEDFAAPAPVVHREVVSSKVAVAAGVEEDDALSYFARLAEED